MGFYGSFCSQGIYLRENFDPSRKVEQTTGYGIVIPKEDIGRTDDGPDREGLEGFAPSANIYLRHISFRRSLLELGVSTTEQISRERAC